MKTILLWFVASLLLLGLATCEQSDPDPSVPVAALSWSGWDWTVKSSDSLTGPGLNYFSNLSSDVFVDDNNNLHLRIVKRDNKWYSTEIVSNNVVGYGEYQWTVVSDFDKFDPYTILGLFTWDNDINQANTEIDIEMARWGNAGENTNVQFTVQPSNAGAFYERQKRALVPSGTPTTHVFRWKKRVIEWASFVGNDTNSQAIARFRFDSTSTSIQRVKNVGGRSSQPIVVPKPTPRTNVRLNFWTMGSEFRRQPGPANNRSAEVVIKNFIYKRY